MPMNWAHSTLCINAERGPVVALHHSVFTVQERIPFFKWHSTVVLVNETPLYGSSHPRSVQCSVMRCDVMVCSLQATHRKTDACSGGKKGSESTNFAVPYPYVIGCAEIKYA